MFLVRWRFEYKDKPPKFGMWSNPGPKDDLATKAWCHNSDSLVMACVEAKHIETRETKIIVACDGHDFINFEWMAAAFMNPLGLRGAITPLTRLLGISLVTRDYKYNVLHDGTIEKKERTEDEKNINYATFGR